MTTTHADRIATLRKRRDHLAERVHGRPRGELSWDRAELAALNWAIRILEAAAAEGVLDELDGMPGRRAS